VLFITSNTEVGVEEKVFDVGAADYIVKPLKPRVVAARVQTHLDYHLAIRLLEKQAHTDSMTGLANRRTFDERLIEELKRAHREQESLTVVLIDIDEFKKFNDHFGHIEGDDCIKSIALALALGNSLKLSTDLAARYGGEDARTILSDLLKSIEQLNLTHAPEAKHDVVTISIGYSTVIPEQKYANDSDDWAVIKAADHALYESKKNGRNQISYEQQKT
jgi:diguanylate cyclase (GGDEF)-like protein